MFFFILLNIKFVLCMDFQTLDLITPSKSQGEACGYESCNPTQEGMLNVHIVPHTHYEYGFHRTFYEHYTGYEEFFEKTDINMKRTLDLTITELWGNEKRKFTFADFPYFFHWWSQRDGTVRRMVYQLIRQGRLYFVGGGWGMPDEASTSYHALIEAFTYSLRKLNNTFMECGRPLVAWQSDCYGHSREFTSLAAQMGFDGLFINPISFEDELARMRRMGLEFVWRGSDDLGASSDIFTHKLFDGYWSPPGFCFSSQCTDPLLVVNDVNLNNIEERISAFITSMLDRQGPNYNTSHVMVIMGKVFAYFDATLWFNNIDKLIDSVNEMSYRLGKKVHLSYSTPAYYLKAVHESNSWFETKQDDFFPIAYDHQTYLTGFFTTHPSLKLLVREALVYLQMAKQLQVFARLKNNEKIIEDFGWIFSLMQDHSILTGALRKHVKSYYMQKLYLAIQKSTIILKQAFNKLRESPKWMSLYRCLFNISTCENLNGDNAFIVIYNPLAWTVTLPVRLPVQKSESGSYAIYDGKNNKIPTSLVKIHDPILNLPFRHEADHELVFIADNLPPLGYRCYYFEKTEVRRKRATLLKNLKRRKNKKYLIRQVNPVADGEGLLNDINEYEYFEDDEESTTTEEPDSKQDTKIIFANVSGTTKPKGNKNNENDSKNEDKDGDDGDKDGENNVKNGKSGNKHIEHENSDTYKNVEGSEDKVKNGKTNKHYIGHGENGNNKEESNIKNGKSYNKHIEQENSDGENFNKNVEESENNIKNGKSRNNHIEPSENGNENDENGRKDSENNIKKVQSNKHIEHANKHAEHDKKHTEHGYKDGEYDVKHGGNNFENVRISNKHIEYGNKKDNRSDRHSHTTPKIVQFTPKFTAPTTPVATRTTGIYRTLNKDHIEPYTNDKTTPYTSIHDTATSSDEYLDNEEVNKITVKPNRRTDLNKTEWSTERDDMEDVVNSTDKMQEPSTTPEMLAFAETFEDMKTPVEVTTPSTEGTTEEVTVPVTVPVTVTSENTTTTRAITTTTKSTTQKSRESTTTFSTTLKQESTTVEDSGHSRDNEDAMDTRRQESPLGRMNLKKTQFSTKTKYSSEPSTDTFFGNEYIRIDLDPSSRKISKLTLANGLSINLDLQFYYYISDDPNAEKLKVQADPYPEKQPPHVRKAPGAMIMRTIETKPVPILDYIEAQVYKTEVVQEYHAIYSEWASLVVRVYKDSPVVVVEWLVGPVPIDDDCGKEVFIRYMTDLVNDGMFYTDSNGRQTIKRIRNVRPMFDSVNTDPVAGNFYPVTSKIYIEDLSKNIRFSVFTDRAEGGTSLFDGEIDLMLQRRILTDDMLFQGFVNETHNNVGVILRGKHFLYTSRANYKPNKIFEKKLAKEIELAPQVLVSVADPYPDKKSFLEHINEKSFLNQKLPIGVHVLTLQEWNDGTLLLRLENYLEKSDVIKTGVKYVKINTLFKNINVKSLRETTLAANIWLENHVPLQWNIKKKFIKSFNEFYATGRSVVYARDETVDEAEYLHVNSNIRLAPQQIRTFVLDFDYVTEEKSW